MSLQTYNMYTENYWNEQRPSCSVSSTPLLLVHPAYSPEDDPVLVLPRFDLVPGSDPPQYGIHHGTLKMICFLITGNKPGFLSSVEIDASAAVPATPPSEQAFDSILVEEKYYYYIHGTNPRDRYRVLDKFTDWCFPTTLGDLPEWQSWTQACSPGNIGFNQKGSDVSRCVRRRDKACQLTGTPERFACNSAHIVPRSELDWFRNNKMQRLAKEKYYGADHTVRSSNMCVLRRDLHALFDARCFTFVPKTGKLVAHFIESDFQYASDAFHNSVFHEPNNLSAQFVLSRLAWSVFPLVSEFNKLHLPTSGQDPNNREGVETDEVEDPWQLQNIARRFSNTPGISSPLKQAGNTLPDAMDHDKGDDIEVDEEREFAEDMVFAMNHYPKVFGSDTSGDGLEHDFASGSADLSSAHLESSRGQVAKHDAETLWWYPGVGRVERMAKAYRMANPQIWQTSGPISAKGREWSPASSQSDLSSIC